MAFSSRRAIFERANLITSSGPLENEDGATQLAGTKVVATLGEATSNIDTIHELLESGVSVFRLDASSLRSPEWHASMLSMVVECARSAGRLTAFMVDMHGCQEVVVCRKHTAPLVVSADTQLTLKVAGVDEWWTPDKPDILPLSDGGRLLEHLQAGDMLHAARYLSTGVAESSLFLVVEQVTVEDGHVVSCVCRALTSATLEGYSADQHCTITRATPFHDQARMDAELEEPPPSALCASDRALIAALVAADLGDNIDFLALSFCESAGQVAEARAMLASHGLKSTAILAKIETRLGVRSFESILAASDGIIICRGCLGNTMPVECVWRLQKEMAFAANIAGKPTLVTRILDSMTASPRPTRAVRAQRRSSPALTSEQEATDVANAVLDGIDGVLLGAETVRGLFPVQVVRTVMSIALEAEKIFSHRRFFYSRMDTLHEAAVRRKVAQGPLPRSPSTASELEGLGLRASMASTLVRVSEKTGAKLICVFTKTGRHALEAAQWRPGVPILALFQPTLTGDGVSWTIRGRSEARRALLLRGVLPVLADPRDGLNETAMLNAALKLAEQSGLVAKGDFVCLSHKLREDISISVIQVGDEGSKSSVLDRTASTAHLSALERTPSAADLAHARRHHHA